MRSLTGFGVGDIALAEGRVVAEIRSVNQRFLDVRARLPRELVDLTLFAEQIARDRLRRGRVELVIRTEGAALVPCALDKDRARAAFRDLAELRDEIAPNAELPLSLLAAVPELFVPPAGPDLQNVRAAVKTAVLRAVDAMEAMCRREGEALRNDLRGRCEGLARLMERVAERAQSVRETMRRRLRERLDRLLAGTEVQLDDGRLEAEVALLADRSDITEELTRLASHIDQFETSLDDADIEPVGRRLDFLLQEMVREANTIGAKAQDAEVSQHVVAIKVELERLREQVQNVE
jgi:uncharacterized protein (TIGR00255 family)